MFMKMNKLREGQVIGKERKAGSSRPETKVKVATENDLLIICQRNLRISNMIKARTFGGVTSTVTESWVVEEGEKMVLAWTGDLTAITHFRLLTCQVQHGLCHNETQNNLPEAPNLKSCHPTRFQ